MNWILILLVMGTSNTPGMTTATFNTEAGCRAAADAAEFVFEPHVRTIKYVCVPNNKPPG
jgi:hypothetical protein